eukprot:c1971_g1_i1.p1 GENE.c1971_g1_i1~~c1971_g1_i1.p1  ORF type:complete len:273 (-),score=66.16 c1971_g1_i1:90-908(-)
MSNLRVCLLIGVVALGLAAPIIPGETEMFFVQEAVEYPHQMEGEEFAPPPSAVNMNAAPKHDAATTIGVVSLLEMPVEEEMAGSMMSLTRPNEIDDDHQTGLVEDMNAGKFRSDPSIARLIDGPEVKSKMSSIMPETVSGVDPMSMEPPTTSGAFDMNSATSHQPAPAPASHPSRDIMNSAPASSSMLASMMTAPVVAEQPSNEKAHTDEMQKISTKASNDHSFEMVDEQQLIEDEGLAGAHGEMPEAVSDDSLVSQMEQNVKVTQVPSWTD